MRAWCSARGVVPLYNLPRTPQHNAAAEHGMRELKEESLLGKGVLRDARGARARLVAARDKLDGKRLRATLGWWTAVQADAEAPHWSALCRREDFARKVACGI